MATPIKQGETTATKKRRTSRVTSYSRKRTSPKKNEQNDTSREPSPTISEPALQEETVLQEENTIPEESIVQEESLAQKVTAVQQKEKSVLLETIKETAVEESCKREIETESSDLTKVAEKDEEPKEVDNISNEVVQNNTSNESVPQTLATKSSVKSSNIVDSPLKSLNKNTENENENQQSVTEFAVKKEEVAENIEVVKKVETDTSKDQENDESKAINDKCDKLDNIQKEVVESEEKTVEQIDEAPVVKPVDDVKVLTTNDAELPTSNLSHQEADANENENDKVTSEDQFLEDKDDVLSNNEKEMDVTIDEKQDEQVTI